MQLLNTFSTTAGTGDLLTAIRVPVTQPGFPVDFNWGFGVGTLGVVYEVRAVAIRTTPSAPVESASFGEIKAMFRQE